jgi:hypothetical protein
MPWQGPRARPSHSPIKQKAPPREPFSRPTQAGDRCRSIHLLRPILNRGGRSVRPCASPSIPQHRRTEHLAIPPARTASMIGSYRRPDPFAAYWSLIPASRAGAMAWHPPIFPPPNPFSPENIPASAWVTPLPIFLNSLGQFPSTAPKPPDLPPIPASHGLLGGIAKLLAASTPPDVPEIGPGQGLLGAIARLPDASTPPNVPAIDAGQDLLGAIARLPDASTPPNVPAIGPGQGLIAPMLWAQPVPIRVRPIFRSTVRSNFWHRRAVLSALTFGKPGRPRSSPAEPVRRHKRISDVQCKRNNSARPGRATPGNHPDGPVRRRRSLSRRPRARWPG